MALPSEVVVVCVAVGSRYPDLYVAKLQSMLRRNMPVPFRLVCLVDRPRKIPSDIEVIDVSKMGLRREGMRVTTDKLSLFDPQAMPYSEFLYLDTTLVIQKEMGPLLEYAYGRSEELVVVKDWNYDCYNTCVMRIRTGGDLAVIPQEFLRGTIYPRRNPGDQDFVTACVREKGLEDRVATFPPEMIVSYRNARTVNLKDPAAAHAYLVQGIIVKFFGKPKMHQLLNPVYRLFKVRIARRKIGGKKDARFWIAELKELWR